MLILSLFKICLLFLSFKSPLAMFNKLWNFIFFPFFLVILLDSKAQQTELEWISSPPNGVSTAGKT